MTKVDTSKITRRAEEAIQRRNYDLAILNYRHALDMTPHDIDIRLKLRATQLRKTNEQGPRKVSAVMRLAKAVFFALLGKHDRAMAACDDALSANAQCLPAMFRFAESAAKIELHDVAAFQRQEIADRVAPDHIDNLFALADLYEELARPQDAILALEKIRQIDSQADVGPQLTRLEALKTSEIYSQGVKSGSRSIVENADMTAKLETESGRQRTDEQRDKAIELITNTDLVQRPEDHRILIRLAEIAADYEDPEKAYARAKEYLGKAAQLNPIDNTVKDRMGDLEIKRRRVALKGLQTKVQAAHGDAAARAQYQEARKELFAFEIDEFERRVKAQPLKADFHNRLGELYHATHRYEEAIGELQAASKDPKYRIAALTNLGRCFMETGQIDLAINQFRAAREGQELFDRIRDPLYFEAQAQERKGTRESLKEALEVYTRIYQTDINFRDVKEKMPAVQKRLGEMN